MSTNPFVLILGMHRSGTSCLAGSLEACGLFLGDVSRRGRFNAKGNRESKEIWMLHDQILGLNRGSWHEPPEKITVHPAHADLLSAAIAKLTSHNLPAGIKDPRCLLLLQQWMDLAGSACRLVGTFRHPMAVAKSLAARDNIPVEKGLDLWARYNQKMVTQHQLAPFPLIKYDLSHPHVYCRKIVFAAAELGLRPKYRPIKRFVSDTLEHHESDAEIPASCHDLYEYLQANGVNYRDAESTRTPDSIRQRIARLFTTVLPKAA